MIKNISRITRILFLTFFLFSATPNYGANIILDLGGVITGTSHASFLYQIGVWKYIRFVLTFNNPFSLKKRLFSLLANMPSYSKNIYGAQDGSKEKLPDIFCDWMIGAQTSEQIKEEVNSYINDNPDFFYNHSEKDILSSAINMMFTPERLISATSLFPGAIEFVKACKQQGHNLFILSNWDAESFDLLYKKYPKFFELFDEENIIVSGYLGLMKPDLEIYTYLLYEYDLDPQSCIFIDDQQVNIDAAEKLGIHGILCKKPDYTFLQKKLDQFIEYEHEVEEEETSLA